MPACVTPLRGRVVIREIRPDRTGSIWHPDQAQDPKRDEKSHRGSSWRSVLRCSRRRLRAPSRCRTDSGRRCGPFRFRRVVRRARTYHDLEDDLPVVWLTQSEILAVEAP